MYSSLESDESEQSSNSGRFIIAHSPWAIGQSFRLPISELNQQNDRQLTIERNIMHVSLSQTGLLMTI